MKRMIAWMLALALALCLTGCGSKKESASAPTALRFSDAVSFERIQELDGQKVSIIGYMATMSPISGKYMYLMNMPYQSCPFCLPNTSQLSNTMAVYAPEGKTFEYTDQAIRITGTMVVEDMVDEFGYAYNYRIADAAYELVDLSTISEEYALWQAIATDGIVAELSAMFDYLHFLCQWTEYQGSYVDESGASIEFFMYPGDVEQYLADDSAPLPEGLSLDVYGGYLSGTPTEAGLSVGVKSCSPTYSRVKFCRGSPFWSVTMGNWYSLGSPGRGTIARHRKSALSLTVYCRKKAVWLETLSRQPTTVMSPVAVLASKVW